MNQEKFWRIIDQTIENYQHTMTSYLDELSFQLEMLSKEEVILWDVYFDAYMELAAKEKLWAGAFLLNKGECSDDDFDYFRAWLISMGKDYYLAILADVDELAELIVSQPETYTASFEELIYLAQDVFIDKVKRHDTIGLVNGEREYFEYLERLSLSQEEKNRLFDDITYDQDINLIWDETRFKRVTKRLPKLTEKYLKYMDKDATKYEASSSSDELFEELVIE